MKTNITDIIKYKLQYSELKFIVKKALQKTFFRISLVERKRVLLLDATWQHKQFQNLQGLYAI